MPHLVEERKEATGFFKTAFYYAFRSLFFPVTKILMWARVTPNGVTVFSMVLAILTGVLMAVDWLGWGIIAGLAMGFSDIVDGQLAKVSGQTSRFGGILDSAVDRYNEFFVIAGYGARYYWLGRPWMVFACAAAFAGSVMVSYVKARAEADGYECKVGQLQRPERLSLIGVGTLIAFLGYEIGLDAVIVFLAVATQITAIHRLEHVRRQTLRSS